jgi:hypothetical protein
MARKKVVGRCRICLEEGDLTFEHVPPEAAFNKSKVQIVQGDAALQLPPGEISGGRYQQRGSGAYTLCERCNNNTGSWYGAAFVDWCVAGGEALKLRQQTFAVPNFFPLRVVKQIVAMFCSLRGPELVEQHPDIKPFLLDRERNGMPSGMRIFVHHAVGKVSRGIGFAAKLDLNTGTTTVMSELVFPPFGYLMTYGGDDPPDPSAVVEITSFADHHYDDCKALAMTLAVVPTFSPFPGDYRTKEELEATAAENRRWEAEHQRQQWARSSVRQKLKERQAKKKRQRQEQRKARRKHR